METRIRSLVILWILLLGLDVDAQPAYTANDLVNQYDGTYRPGCNLGIYAPWTDEQLGDLAAGNPDIDLPGIGAKALRPALYEHFVEQYGYELRVPSYEHFDRLGLKDHTLIVGFPSQEHRDPTQYCPGVQSELFANLYLDIWDNGENGTPVNDDNHYALYLYRLIKHYGPYVRFWEIWNEPGFDYTGARGWAEPGVPGNWWENNPDPCEYKLRAPIFHYIRILRISWEVIKGLAPEDFIVVSGVGYPSFLDALLRNTDNPNGGGVTAEFPLKGGAYFDVMGYHAYPHFDGSLRYWDNSSQSFAYKRHSDAAARGLIESQELFRQVLNRYGYDGLTYPRKHWMITECNVPRKAFSDYIGSDDAQRNFVSKASILCQINNILQLHIYKIGEEAEYDKAQMEFELMGLYKKLEGVDPYFAPLNNSGISYKTTSDLLFAKTYDPDRTAALNLPASVEGGAFRDADGHYTYALWAKTTEDQSETASMTYRFPASLNLPPLIRREWDYGLTFEQETSTDPEVVLSASPSFFTESRFSASTSSGCLPLDIRFDGQGLPNGLRRRWTFEGGQPFTSTEASPQVRYSTAGQFEAKLEYLDADGNVQFQQSQTIAVSAAPDAAFDSYHSGPIVVLTNQTGLTADAFQWDFGDGNSSTAPSPTHVYYESGEYEIRLVATNECGESEFSQRFNVKAPETSRLTYTANDTIVPYQGQFRPGVNLGAYRLWSDQQLANISAGNVLEGIDGVGAKCVRPILDEKFLEKWGYDIRLDAFQHYVNLDLDDNTLMVGFPSDAHRDPNFYCANDQSELFENLYLDIWDNGENGTPVNDNNYYALYLYKTVSRYKDFVKFWEIWNEPSFDFGGHGWKEPGLIGNWWENNPNPCDYKLKAPIFHYIRILRISYEIIKQLDPEAYVALSGVAYPSFLDAILRNTDNPLDGSQARGYERKGGAYFDVMGFHTYPHFDGSTRYFDVDLLQFVNERHSDAAIRGISKLQDEFTELLVDYGYDGQTFPEKYWIITEANVPRKRIGIFMGSAEVQRNYIIKAYVQSVRRNFLQLHVYKIGEEGTYNSATDEFAMMGLYQKLDGLPPYRQTINDVGIAYKTASDILYGTTYDAARTQALALPSTVDGGAFRDANGRYIYVLWARTQVDLSEAASATYRFPSSLNIDRLHRREWNYSATQQQTTLSNQNIELSGAPLFLLEQASTLMPPIAAFRSGQTIGCEPFRVRFEEKAVRANQYRWTFPGGNPSTSNAPNPEVVYPSEGIYPVTLEVRNNAGSHAATYTRHIEVKSIPSSDFTFEVNGNWADFQSVVGYNDSISYFWVYGDGYTSPGIDPEHYYFNNGAYEVQLIATNRCGSDTTTKTVYIQNPPVAEFSTVVSSFCPPHDVLFLDLSPSDPQEWYWAFPGGTPATSTERNPEVSYPSAGTYEAMLVVSNAFGKDTLYQSFYLEAGIEEYVNEQLCDDEQIVVNGTIYDASNPSGTETLPAAGILGCDSVIYINLSFGTSSETLLNEQLCAGEELLIGTTIYNESRPAGTELIAGGNARGCDSLVQVELSFHPPATFLMNPTLCSDDGRSINGTLYNRSNPRGVEVIAGGSINGCDSTITIDLSFYPAAEHQLTPMLCPGEFVLVNGRRYDEDRIRGTEIFPNATDDGCDSIVYIDLGFHAPAKSLWNQAYCLSAAVEINGTIYDANNPTGREVIPGGSINGCDSIIEVDLQFDEVIYTDQSVRLCKGEGYLFGDTYYAISGTFTDTLSSLFGCDSIARLHLDILDDPIIQSVDVSLCAGELYNGIYFDQDVVLVDSLVNDIGCDSLVYTFIEVAPVKERQTDVWVCEGRFFRGVRYTHDTTLIEVYQSAEGCDSTLAFGVDVIPSTEAFIQDTIYLNESYLLGDSAYNQSGLYMDTLINAAGCDSIVHLNLTVLDLVSTNALADRNTFGLTAQPNPFQASLTIGFELPLAAEVRLDLLDVHGRKVKELASGEFMPGHHRYRMEQLQLSAGLYWCRLQAAGKVAVVKLIHVE
ncbi:MAG: PKD domain-containing protein [Bacteroidota bacterium]